MKYWCAANSNLACFIELTTALECQKQLLMSSISNLGGRESVEIAVNKQFEHHLRLFNSPDLFQKSYFTQKFLCTDGDMYSHRYMSPRAKLGQSENKNAIRSN